MLLSFEIAICLKMFRECSPIHPTVSDDPSNVENIEKRSDKTGDDQQPDPPPGSPQPLIEEQENQQSETEEAHAWAMPVIEQMLNIDDGLNVKGLQLNIDLSVCILIYTIIDLLSGNIHNLGCIKFQHS